ncbi:MAG: hypothetical protein AAF196_06555 [Planctomycetota bacterium]
MTNRRQTNRLRALWSAWLRVDLAGADSPTSTSTIASASFLALGLAALTFSPKDYASTFSAAHLSFAAIWIGAAALADPESLSRRRADRLLLATAPLGALERRLAIAVRHGLRITLLAIGVGIGPAVFLAATRGGSFTGSAWHVLATVWIAWLATLLTGSIQNSSDRFFGRSGGALALGVVRALALALLLGGFATCVAGLRGTPDDLPFGGAWVDAVPTLWLARLAQGTAHTGDGLAVLAFTASVLLIALVARPAEGLGAGRLGRLRGPLSRLEARLCHDPGELGVARFLSAQMLRNPAFRARVLPLIGLPVALTILGFDSESAAAKVAAGIVAAFPAIFLPLVAALFRTDDDTAGWPFQTAPIDALEASRRATRIVLAVRLIWPLAIPLAIALVAFGFLAPLPALTVALFGAALGDWHAERIGQRLHAVPFTTPEGSSDTGEALTIGLLLAAVAGVFASRADHPVGLLVAAIVVGLRLRNLANGAKTKEAPS